MTGVRKQEGSPRQESKDGHTLPGGQDPHGEGKWQGKEKKQAGED
jgi:hypothetical protein